MKFSSSKEPLSVFSFSSLTDIVMLLIIFFLLTSQFVVQTGVKVKLPSSTSAEQPKQSKLVVTITAQGTIYSGNEQVSLEQLPAKLSQMKAETNSDNLIIRADKAAMVDMVIKVIDAARFVNIEKFTIQTEQESN